MAVPLGIVCIEVSEYDIAAARRQRSKGAKGAYPLGPRVWVIDGIDGHRPILYKDTGYGPVRPSLGLKGLVSFINVEYSSAAIVNELV